MRRFAKWLHGCVSRGDVLRAMQETRDATIEMIGSAPSAHDGPKSGPWVVHMTWRSLTEQQAKRLRKVMSDLKKDSDVKFRLQEPLKSDDTVVKAIAASLEAARKWDWCCPNCRRGVSEPPQNAVRDVPEPPKSQGCAEKMPTLEGRPPPTEH